MVVLHFSHVVKQKIYKLEIIKSIAQAQTHTHTHTSPIRNAEESDRYVYCCIWCSVLGPPRMNTGLYL